jgi:hypothetical protein
MAAGHHGMEHNDNFPLYSEVCMGGTYDRMHVGHKLLLSHAALVTEKRLFCGIMGQFLGEGGGRGGGGEGVLFACVSILWPHKGYDSRRMRAVTAV